MKLSVVIPVYNVEKYLHQCVQSVLLLPDDIEIILVDDGSKDSSGKLCDELQKNDDRIRVIHQENAGLSAARNTGIRNSSGDYVMFLDSDDFLDVDQTLKLLEKLDGTSNVVVGLYRKYYGADHRYENESDSPFMGKKGLMKREDFLSCIPSNGENSFLVAVRFVVQRQWLLDNSLLFFTGIYHEDEEWTVRLLCASEKICLTDYYFYQYRQAREGSIMSSVSPKHVWDTFTILEHHSRLLSNYKADNKVVDFIKNRMASLYLSNLLNLRRLNKEDKHKAIKAQKAYSKQCLPVLQGAKGKFARILVKTVGMNCTVTVLDLIQKIRGR